jgi:uncharacterized protein (DUF433 family)
MMADLTIHDDRVPLTKWDDGSIRVGKTRVLFYLVVQAFQRGADPERIVRMYRTLDLADTYAVFSYYLRHKAEVDRYLGELNAEAEEMRKRIEAEQGPPPVTREILQARRKAREEERDATPRR